MLLRARPKLLSLHHCFTKPVVFTISFKPSEWEIAYYHISKSKRNFQQKAWNPTVVAGYLHKGGLHGGASRIFLAFINWGSSLIELLLSSTPDGFNGSLTLANC